MSKNLNETQQKIKDNYSALCELQLDKNQKYGNAGLEPLGIFFQKDHFKDDLALAGLLCRLDDKLMRVKNSKELRVNDIADLIGYLNLTLINLGVSKESLLSLKD